MEAHPMPHPGEDERSTAQLVNDLSEQVVTLVRQELELARVELAAKGKRAGIGIGMLGLAGVIALAVLGAATAAGILALAIVIPAWAAALAVAGFGGLLIGLLALLGFGEFVRVAPPYPEQTVESVKADIEAAREHAGGARA
jgi:uncharacterized membrane protein YqjE